MPDAPVTLRQMQPSDFSAADALRAAAGWNQTLDDWQRFITCEPRGCFVAERGGAVVGVATTICYGIELGWIGMLLVHPDQRRCGIGSQLLTRSIEFLEERGAKCIKLDATPAGQPVYERFGFKPECELTRWEGVGASCGPSQTRLMIGSKAELERMIQLDEAGFGLERRQLLAELSQRAFRTRVAGVQLKQGFGFGMLRAGSRAFYLGPVVAHSHTVAVKLITALLGDIPGRPVFWDILNANRSAMGFAQGHGFRPQRTLLRMYRGVNESLGNPKRQFGIIDPAVG